MDMEAIRKAVSEVAPPAVIIVGPDEWAALCKLANDLTTANTAQVTQDRDGYTVSGLPIYKQRGNGWHVMNVPPDRHDLLDEYERIKPNGHRTRIVPGEPISRADLIEALQRREHHYRNASEGEYDANLLMKARHMIEHGEA